MVIVGVAAAVALIALVFVDAFEAMILPRRVRHSLRLARLFYRSAWIAWRATARLLPAGKWRHGFLSVFGPLSLFGLLTVWAAGLITGFALLHWSLGTSLSSAHEAQRDFATYWYFSGTTFFTLGYGDIVPTGGWGRTLSVAEAGIGFGFLAIVISYLPVLYQAFSRREIAITLLDARAGSPPTASEFLRRLGGPGSLTALRPLLAGWERWSAELLESHLSFPVLTFYRSQHDNQSWLAALSMILDTSAVVIAGVEGGDSYQARLTFAMARHTAVDLALVFETPPRRPPTDRLADGELAGIWGSLREAGVAVRDGAGAGKALAELRDLYEPFVNALAVYFLFAVPRFHPDSPAVDNWQTSAWTRRSPALSRLPAAGAEDDHFD